MNVNIFLTATLLLGFLACQSPPDPLPVPPPVNLPTTAQYPTGPRGKDLAATEFVTKPYGPVLPLDTLGFPEPTADLPTVLARQEKLLDRRWDNRTASLGLYTQDGIALQEVQERLTAWVESNDPAVLTSLQAIPLSGRNGKGHVKFTGYYAPELEVRRTPNATFRYPIYRAPKAWEGPLPTRQEIDELGALKGRNLEIAYAADPVDVYYLQLQGSGYLNFMETGKRVLVTYDGTNRKPYRSMERAVNRHPELSPRRLDQQYLKPFLARHPTLRREVLNANPSYTFFRTSTRELSGAAGVPLSAGYSVAVDPEVIPLGSVLLAALPVSDGTRVTHHEYRLFFAQDTGGKIRGSGRVDVFFGAGPEAAVAAGQLHHYGKLWILHPGEVSEMVASLM